MTIKDAIEAMTDDDIIDILIDLGSDDYEPVKDGIMFQTVCHKHDGKKKLHYHSDSKTFFCYTECGSIGNIFSLVMKTKEYNWNEAKEYVYGKLGYETTVLKYGFTAAQVDNSFMRKFDTKEHETEEVIPRDEKYLNRFWPNLFHKSWIDDYITIETMKLFGIRYDITGQRIIIPHYDEYGTLIGIRCRNFDQWKVDEGKKYMPITIDDMLFNYPISLNFFGLNTNKNAIKRYRKAIIGESEKFVLQHYSFYGESIALAISGSSLSDYQVELLKKYGVEEVVIALDKEFTNEEEETKYKEKIQKSFIAKLAPYFIVSIIWDTDNVLDNKMSPTDRGKEIFEKLYGQRIFV